MTQRLLQPAFMIKRSRNKGRFKSSNFKSRWFVLTKDYLSYHAGNASVSFPIPNIKIVEIWSENILKQTK